MSKKSRGLGRGLSALITDVPTGDDEPIAEGVTTLPIDQIVANPYQPRKEFDVEALKELVKSIKVHGVLQPLAVRQVPKGYQLIAGERRFRASKEAGLNVVPVVVLDVDDRNALELAMIENLQRDDLNIIEEALGYQRLADDFNLTQEQIAKQMGKGRATIANALRLLTLSANCRQLVVKKQLTAGHAKVLLGLEKKGDQDAFAAIIISESLSVRETEKRLAEFKQPNLIPETKKPSSTGDLDEQYVNHITDALNRHFGTKVRLASSRTSESGKTSAGKIEFEFYSSDDLTRLLDVMGFKEEL